MFELLAFAEPMCFMSSSDGLGCSKSTVFEVELYDEFAEPVSHALRYLAPVKQEFVDKEIGKMESLGVITRKLSSWNAAIVVAPKPGPGDDWRFCTDFRDLNDRTRTIRYPFPLIDDILAALGSAKYFVKIDLAKGYW